MENAGKILDQMCQFKQPFFVNSIRHLVNFSKSPLKVILEESSKQDLCLIPKSGRRGMIAKSAWNSMRIKNDQDTETVKIRKGKILTLKMMEWHIETFQGPPRHQGTLPHHPALSPPVAGKCSAVSVGARSCR